MSDIEKILEYINSYYNSYYRIDSLYNEWAADHGIKDTTLFVLDEIFIEQEECTQRKVSEKLGYPKQTVSFILNKLEEQGIICREKLPHDQRNNLVRFTEDGMKYAEKILVEMKNAEIEAYQSMTDKEQMAVTAGMEILASALEKSFQKRKK